MILLASRKLRNKEATSKSCLNIFWNVVLGKVVHAIVSVIAVNTQLSSPLGVLRSLSLPGMFSDSPGSIFCIEKGVCRMNHLNAIGRGVVRQDVNTSAGYKGFMGRIWLAWHAASTIILPSIAV